MMLWVWCMCVAVSALRLGVGIADVTGPAAEVGMMGYAAPHQNTAGIHFRLRSRAFAFVDDYSQDTLVFVSVDLCMMFSELKLQVLDALERKLGSGRVRQDNLMISATHTHSGPAGFTHYPLYNIVSLGFQKKNFDAIVSGIVASVEKAFNSLSAPGGAVLLNTAQLFDANINRSPTSYEADPAEERNKYSADGNTDKLFTLLKLVDRNGTDLGMISWFSVHGTSMNNSNLLISGDNKGYASLKFEEKMNGFESLPGKGPFVAAFAQTNEGDSSPNTKGPSCPDGCPCDNAKSTCNGLNEGCTGKGPGEDDFESTKIIGGKQLDLAFQLFQDTRENIGDKLASIHQFVDLSSQTIPAEFSSTGKEAQTCPGALGVAFAAGTTDGPGEFDFTQGSNSSSDNIYWRFITRVLHDPSPDQVKCHFPKPILFDTQLTEFPAPWTPAIMPLQIFRIGRLFIVGVPGEFTTMSGRRLRDSVTRVISKEVQDPIVVIAGLANGYSHYVTTFEEYQYQRYEGASTLYGPHTLAAYQVLYSKLAEALVKNETTPPGPSPPDLRDSTFNFLPDVYLDEPPFGKDFGDLRRDIDSSQTFIAGKSTIAVEFYSGHPRNNFRQEDTFLTIERKQGNGFKVIATDGNWETKFFWRREGIVASIVTVSWEIPAPTPPGVYRICHFGDFKGLLASGPYSGCSSLFHVSASS